MVVLLVVKGVEGAEADERAKRGGGPTLKAGGTEETREEGGCPLSVQSFAFLWLFSPL